MATFEADVSRFLRKYRDRMDIVFRKVALDMFTKVIMRSPVDTGRFRGNWQVAIGRVPDGVLDLTDKSGRATISKATAASMNLRAGQVIYLANNLPYARRLEYGWSKQAPRGMVRITIREFNASVRKAAAAAKRERP